MNLAPLSLSNPEAIIRLDNIERSFGTVQAL